MFVIYRPMTSTAAAAALARSVPESAVQRREVRVRRHECARCRGAARADAAVRVRSAARSAVRAHRAEISQSYAKGKALVAGQGAGRPAMISGAEARVHSSMMPPRRSSHTRACSASARRVSARRQARVRVLLRDGGAGAALR